MNEVFPDRLGWPFAYSGTHPVAELRGQMEVERCHRYLLAREFCRGRDVLDVASGAGYGAAMLSRVARSVVGVDSSPETVLDAAHTHACPNLRFLVGDACILPLADSTVDVAVSFETIGCLKKLERFLAEIRRVLRPGGLLIVGISCRDPRPPLRIAADPCDVGESDQIEFEALLRTAFAEVSMLCQRGIIGSIMLPGPGAVHGTIVPAITLEQRKEQHFEACSGLSRASYVIALASDAVEATVLPRASLLVEARWFGHDRALEVPVLEAQLRAAERRAAAAEARAGVLEGAVRRASASADEALTRLHLIERSTTWRVLKPVRRLGDRFPRARRLLRGGVRFAWVSARALLLRPGRHGLRASGSGAEAADGRVSRLGIPPDWRERIGGSYGGLRLRYEDLAPSARGRDAPEVQRARYEAGTRAILERFRSVIEHDAAPPGEWERWMPTEALKARLCPVSLPASASALDSPLGFSIVTPYFRHEALFRDCARSVAEVFAASDGLDMEWIVVNDDPMMTAERLCEVVPPAIRPFCRIIGGGTNRGIARRLDEGIRAARHDWVLLLDCDDRLRPEAPAVLAHYIARFPRARYISSCMIDIAEDGTELRRRLRFADQTDLLDQGMVAGHLMALRRDLYAELGGYDPSCTGCQDYDLALRAAAREPLLLVPDHLYEYRWHGSSQSVSAARRQANIAGRVRHRACVALTGGEPRGLAAPALHAPPTAGLCAIRTQGTRLDLLVEAVDSVACQSAPLIPCVVVHGDTAAVDRVRAALADIPAARVLHADAPGRRRGYPLNVALDYALAAGEEVGWFCILDDDDIYYPLFAERMAEALTLTGADVVHCLHAQREPWEPASAGYLPLPAAALLIANFIPTNAVVLRTETLRATGVRFREDMEYLEDWEFLVQVLGRGARFAVLWETLSEFRHFGDGNRVSKRLPELYAACEETVRARAREVMFALGPDAFARSVLDFDFARRPPLSDQERAVLEQARSAFEAMRPQAEAA